jgi:hypothetical protein
MLFWLRSQFCIGKVGGCRWWERGQALDPLEHHVGFIGNGSSMLVSTFGSSCGQGREARHSQGQHQSGPASGKPACNAI